MGDERGIGTLTFGKKEEQIFLGREIAQHRDYSEETARKIDQEVKRLILEAYDKAQTLLKDNLKILHRLAQSLLEKETLDGETIDRIIQGKEEPGNSSQNGAESKQEKV